MVRSERLHPGKVSKLGSRGSGPFKVLKRIGTNAYELELPKEFGVNSTFNVSDLVPYRGLAVEPSKELEPSSSLEREPSPPPSIQRHRRRQVDRILDEQTTVTRNQVYQRYLVRWKDQPPTEDTWMSREDLMQHDPDILERFQAEVDPYSMESSSSHPGGFGEDTSSPSLWLGQSPRP